jgi:hypothetical protein
MKQGLQILTVTSVCVVLAGGCAHESSRPTSYERYTYVEQTPPPPQVEERSAPPGTDYVWSEGHWEWRDNAWVWASGTWVTRPDPHAKWIPGCWERHGQRYYWVPGHWRT